MFTGIVKGAGEVLGIDSVGGDRRLTIGLAGVDIGEYGLGSSICVNGVCLTVVAVSAAGFSADVSNATLSVTNLGSLKPRSRVNLEPSLRIGEPLDGHLVTGHVDGIGRVVEVGADARSSVYGIELPSGLSRYVARKGSIAVDGVSLTVNAVDLERFEVNIVPHTRALTIIGAYDVGTAVNIEVDIVARYLERLAGVAPDGDEISMETLQKHGYTNRS